MDSQNMNFLMTVMDRFHVEGASLVQGDTSTYRYDWIIRVPKFKIDVSLLKKLGFKDLVEEDGYIIIK